MINFFSILYVIKGKEYSLFLATCFSDILDVGLTEKLSSQLPSTVKRSLQIFSWLSRYYYVIFIMIYITKM